MNLTEQLIAMGKIAAYQALQMGGLTAVYTQGTFTGTYYVGESVEDQEEMGVAGTEAQVHKKTFLFAPGAGVGLSDPAFPPTNGPKTDDVVIFGGNDYVVRSIPSDALGCLYQLRCERTRAHHIGARP